MKLIVALTSVVFAALCSAALGQGSVALNCTVSEYLSADTPRAVACLEAIPFNQTLAKIIVSALKTTFQAYGLAAFSLDAPNSTTAPNFIHVGVDVQAGLDKIASTNFSNDFAFQKSVFTLVMSLRDSGVHYIPAPLCYGFSFVQPVGFFPTLDASGKEVIGVYSWSIYSPINDGKTYVTKAVNGQDPIAFFSSLAAKISPYKETNVGFNYAVSQFNRLSPLQLAPIGFNPMQYTFVDNFGQVSNFTLPWVIDSNFTFACLSTSPNSSAERDSTPSTKQDIPKSKARRSVSQYKDCYIPGAGEIYNGVARSDFKWTDPDYISMEAFLDCIVQHNFSDVMVIYVEGYHSRYSRSGPDPRIISLLTGKPYQTVVDVLHSPVIDDLKTRIDLGTASWTGLSNHHYEMVGSNVSFNSTDSTWFNLFEQTIEGGQKVFLTERVAIADNQTTGVPLTRKSPIGRLIIVSDGIIDGRGFLFVRALRDLHPNVTIYGVGGLQSSAEMGLMASTAFITLNSTKLAESLAQPSAAPNLLHVPVPRIFSNFSSQFPIDFEYFPVDKRVWQPFYPLAEDSVDALIDLVLAAEVYNGLNCAFKWENETRAADLKACLLLIPFDADIAKRTLESVRLSLELYGLTDMYYDFNSTVPTFSSFHIDIAAELQRISKKNYSSDYPFQLDVLRLVQSLKDPSIGYDLPSECYNIDMSLSQPFYLDNQLDSNNKDQIVITGQAMGLTSFASYVGCSVNRINGLDAVDYFVKRAQTHGRCKDSNCAFDRAVGEAVSRGSVSNILDFSDVQYNLTCTNSSNVTMLTVPWYVTSHEGIFIDPKCYTHPPPNANKRSASKRSGEASSQFDPCGLQTDITYSLGNGSLYVSLLSTGWVDSKFAQSVLQIFKCANDKGYSQVVLDMTYADNNIQPCAAAIVIDSLAPNASLNINFRHTPLLDGLAAYLTANPKKGEYETDTFMFNHANYRNPGFNEPITDPYWWKGTNQAIEGGKVVSLTDTVSLNPKSCDSSFNRTFFYNATFSKILIYTSPDCKSGCAAVASVLKAFDPARAIVSTSGGLWKYNTTSFSSSTSTFMMDISYLQEVFKHSNDTLPGYFGSKLFSLYVPVARLVLPNQTLPADFVYRPANGRIFAWTSVVPSNYVPDISIYVLIGIGGLALVLVALALIVKYGCGKGATKEGYDPLKGDLEDPVAHMDKDTA